MKKPIIFILLTVLILGVFTACNGDLFADLINGGSKVTITFKANGGTGDDKTQEVEKDVETALAANSFTSPDENYVFAGWTTGSDGSGTYYGDKETVTLTENLVLYAQWAVDLANTTLSKTSWTNGNVYLMSDNVPISDRITVTGSVTLILPKDKTLTASSGITVAGTNSLTINGNGSLIAGGTETTVYAAGIGGENNQAGGTITINGGTVTAKGGSYASVIGGGNRGNGGTVTINGGTVTANGGENAAGIGGGVEGAGGTVTINGGIVTANGGYYGAGIGGGHQGAGGTISITGGTVTATGGKYSAGIGGGHQGAGGTISITGGTVTATGGICGAGIGGGIVGDGGTVTINGGTVTATGGSADGYQGSGAGIGGGFNSAGGTVTITGGTVTATGGSGNEYHGSGTGIGAGSNSISLSHGTLTIGENSTTPYTDGKLRIASGWVLYYGESSASTSIGEGTYDSWSGYAKKYMNVTQP